jgi:uncharacterized protein YecE (DUF72 family)
MIRVGIGGWTFAPWRGGFYPADLKQADELGYAASKLTTIEINGTFYRTQSAASFAKWRDQTPDDFVFTVKGHRNIVNSRKLGETKESIGWFFASGVLELGPKLGPILWQMPPFKRFDGDDVAAFLALLPREIGGRPLTHAIEPRHASFKEPRFVEICRDAGVAIVKADSAKYPMIGDLTGEIVYARLQNAAADEPNGYAETALDRWAAQSRDWADGRADADASLVAGSGDRRTRPVFVFMINGAKERAPAAALGLIKRLAAGQ